MEVAQQNLFFMLASILNKELYFWRKFCLVLREGPKDSFFEDEAANGSNDVEEEDFNGIDWSVFSTRNWTEDIELVQNQGILIDNDQHFNGHYGIDLRATSVPFDQEPSFQCGILIFQKDGPIQVLPWQCCSADIICSCLASPLSENKFHQCIGKWLLMSTCSEWQEMFFGPKKSTMQKLMYVLSTSWTTWAKHALMPS